MDINAVSQNCNKCPRYFYQFCLVSVFAGEEGLVVVEFVYVLDDQYVKTLTDFWVPKL